MKTILGYIRSYFYGTDRSVLLIVTIFTGLLIFLNYYLGIDDAISIMNDEWCELAYRTAIFLLAFGVPYFAYAMRGKRNYFSNGRFLVLLILAPFLFALKMVVSPAMNFSEDLELNHFWNQVFYWPALLMMMLLFLLAIWKTLDKEQPFYGTITKGMNFRPYLIMLLCMIPLIAAASTQPDFLAMYPKLKTLDFNLCSLQIDWWHKLLFELSYGSDFVSIELFFRGFRVLAFVKFAGKEAILPMACFYCTIHFGKPLGECISSYFGGMLLGIVVYHTRSIFGGLMVHLGIAWMMEIGGYIGNLSIN